MSVGPSSAPPRRNLRRERTSEVDDEPFPVRPADALVLKQRHDILARAVSNAERLYAELLLNLKRLDALLATVWVDAMHGDLKALAEARRIVDSQSRLTGYF